MSKEETIQLNPLIDRLIGVKDELLYFKSEYLEYIVVTKEKEYLKLVKKYINTKRDFCNRYNHFCGVFGEFYAKDYIKLKDKLYLNEPFDVEDNGHNDGLEIREVPYDVYLVYKFNKHCDMEHG